MYSKTALVLSILVATCGTAIAAPRYIGTAIVDKVSAGCGTAAKPGLIINVRFKPGGVGDNGPNSVIDFFTDQQVVALYLANAKIDTTVRTVEATFVAYKPVTFLATIKATPAPNPTTTTTFLSFTGEIGNYIVPSCKMTFKAAMVLQPG